MSKQLLLPKPSGFRVLLKARQVEEKTKGGIILTDDSREAAKFSCVVSEVISMGSDCYHDKNESWCKIGDWVLTAKYVGLKFKYEGEEDPSKGQMGTATVAMMFYPHEAQDCLRALGAPIDATPGSWDAIFKRKYIWTK